MYLCKMYLIFIHLSYFVCFKLALPYLYSIYLVVFICITWDGSFQMISWPHSASNENNTSNLQLACHILDSSIVVF